MPGQRTTSSYEPRNVEVAYSALMEVAATLQAYRDDMVLIGGWDPYLLLKRHQAADNPFRHVGSIDSDWVVNPETVESEKYDTIVQALTKRGFHQTPNILYRFAKSVPVEGLPTPFEISVDLLTVKPPKGKGSAHRHRQVQADLRALATPAAELALAHAEPIDLEGTLLGGGKLTVTVRVGDAVGSIGTKGLALGGRYVEKDSYDIYAVVANYGTGPAAVASLAKPYLGEPLLRKSLDTVRNWFRAIDAAGPVAVGNFYDFETGNVRERRVRDAFETVDRFLTDLGL